MTVQYQTIRNGHRPGGEGLAADDPAASARAAGLRYVTDSAPGIRREERSDGFTYIGTDGTVIQQPDDLRRIQALGIPPAWTNVWICSNPRGHLQATGRDAKGRKQYRYHEQWREVRDQTKYDRLISFAEALPPIRERVAQDLARPGLPRVKILATVVRLLEATAIRVGNETYVRQNHSFGLTTMRNRHVDVAGSTLRFHFRGKSGKKHDVEVHDRRLAGIVKRCRELPGHHLFEYVGEDGQLHTVDSGDVNAYLKEISGQDFTAKEFRTWAGSLLAVRALQKIGACECASQAKKNLVQAIDQVREQLGNTRAVCRKYYVHPAICEAYMAGCLLEQCANQEVAPEQEGLTGEEVALLTFLRGRLPEEAPTNRNSARGAAPKAARSRPNGKRSTRSRVQSSGGERRHERGRPVVATGAPVAHAARG